MEEVDLRDLIETIIKGKWMIIIFTAVCVIIGIIISFFFIGPVYETQTTLMVSSDTDATSSNSDTNKFIAAVGEMSQYPQMTMDTYKELIKTSDVLGYIIKTLDLKGTSLESIDSKITVEIQNNTNLINIKVRDNDPLMAAKIANTAAEGFLNEIYAFNQNKVKNMGEIIKKQQDKQKIILDKALAELKDFIAQPRSPQELKLELDAKLAHLTDYKSQLTQIKIDEQVTLSSLEHARRIMKNTPKVFTLTKALLTDELLAGIIEDKTGLETQDLANFRMKSEEINEVFLDISKSVNILDIQLTNLKAKKQGLENEVSLSQKDMGILQAELAEKQQEYDTLNHNAELEQQAFDAYQQKYVETVIKQTAENAESNTSVISYAVPPESPAAPNKGMNVAIAFILGLMISIFVVFTKDYWNKSKPQDMKA